METDQPVQFREQEWSGIRVYFVARAAGWEPEDKHKPPHGAGLVDDWRESALRYLAERGEHANRAR